MKKFDAADVDVFVGVVQQFQYGVEYLRFYDDWYVLLCHFLQVLQDGVDVLLSLIETHRLSGVLHAQVDIRFIQSVQVLLITLEQGLSNINLLFVFLLHL